jgi:hypothetical protein
MKLEVNIYRQEPDVKECCPILVASADDRR